MTDAILPQALLILGNQLFPHSHLPVLDSLPVFMAEDHSLCTHYRYHKHKLILFLAAMRSYGDALTAAGAQVTYHRLTAESVTQTYEQNLESFLSTQKIATLTTFEIEDKFFESRLSALCSSLNVKLDILPSPMFLVSRDEFSQYLASSKKPFMKTFYEQLRKSRDILMTEEGTPVGGKFSFDADNRKKLPKKLEPPSTEILDHPIHVADVADLVDTLFAAHPGDSASFWLPTTREQSLAWLEQFLEQRFQNFGAYEDAITSRSDIVYHSVLSPLLNMGLVTPAEVIERATVFAEKNEIPLNSLEGFVRQIIGWREFIRGIYQNYSERQDTENFFEHHRKLKPCWYDASTGIPPLDDAIQKAVRLGYSHHIERLMIIGNIMLMCTVDPREVHRWFMEMYVDSSDWVMGPNVYGMGQFSDGGIFATKPYICGSNYLLKMSDYKKGPWCDAIDGLYWQFIDTHRPFFKKNYRMSAIIGNLDRMDAERKTRIYSAADEFRERVTE
ncbi:MAG: cryptochrome/photolyase family protein [Cyanobacteria bacterium P01_F01_bin.116]